jgi:hypothetical protein
MRLLYVLSINETYTDQRRRLWINSDFILKFAEILKVSFTSSSHVDSVDGEAHAVSAQCAEDKASHRGVKPGGHDHF